MREISLTNYSCFFMANHVINLLFVCVFENHYTFTVISIPETTLFMGVLGASPSSSALLPVGGEYSQCLFVIGPQPARWGGAGWPRPRPGHAARLLILCLSPHGRLPSGRGGWLICTHVSLLFCVDILSF